MTKLGEFLLIGIFVMLLLLTNAMIAQVRENLSGLVVSVLLVTTNINVKGFNNYMCRIFR
jgi:hypothetical protein